MELLRGVSARQVIYSCSCQLVLPKHAVSGTMRLTALHVHFIGEVHQPPDEPGARCAPHLPRCPERPQCS